MRPIKLILFLARIAELEHIADRDTKIALVIVLIDIISFGFELAAVLAKVTAIFGIG